MNFFKGKAIQEQAQWVFVPLHRCLMNIVAETRSFQKSGHNQQQHRLWKRVTLLNSLQHCCLSASAGYFPARTWLSYNTPAWFTLFTTVNIYNNLLSRLLSKYNGSYIYEFAYRMACIVYIYVQYCFYLQSHISSKTLSGCTYQEHLICFVAKSTWTF